MLSRFRVRILDEHHAWSLWVAETVMIAPVRAWWSSAEVPRPEGTGVKNRGASRGQIGRDSQTMVIFPLLTNPYIAHT
jgi:hypothetical protein